MDTSVTAATSSVVVPSRDTILKNELFSGGLAKECKSQVFRFGLGANVLMATTDVVSIRGKSLFSARTSNRLAIVVCV